MHYLLNIFPVIEQFDHWLLKKINGDGSNPFFDIVFPLIRQSNFWMPWYLFLFVIVIYNFRRNWWWWIILFLCTVALTDLIGTRIFKHVFERIRPCNDPDFSVYVRMTLKECAPGYSFISNHAANTFGLATFIFLTVRQYFNKWLRLIWLWPFAVCYGQIYVGVHYPSDILAGGLLGVLVGWFTSTIFNKRFGFANFERQPTVTS